MLDSLNSSEKAELSLLLEAKDFETYASNRLKIRTKAGAIEPLTLNPAQIYIHQRFEQQKRETGKVRALVLKGRQQGCCFAPETRVFTADYRWVSLADVEVGQRLLAVDEFGVGSNSQGRCYARKFRTAVVEAKALLTKEAYEVCFDTGVRLEVTPEHRLMFKRRGGCEPEWREVGDAVIGDVVRVALDAPETQEPTFEDGWFAGLLDGEGSFLAAPQVRIGLSQVEGPVLQRAKRYLAANGINYYELIDTRTKVGKYTKLGDKPVHYLRIDALRDILKLMTLTRPSRFVGRELFAGKKLPNETAGRASWAKITSIRSLGVKQVVDIQTSEKTFIAEGLVSHNSTLVEARFYWFTSLNSGMRAFILTHEQPATDNLFDIANRYHENDPFKPDTKAANAKELDFAGLDSGYRVATAGSKAVGRSQTVQYFHGSEVAFWPNAVSHMAGIAQAVPDAAGTEIILESTANGVGGLFHGMWQEAEAGLSEYIAVFVPWFWQPEYSVPPPAGFTLTPEEVEYKDAHVLNDAQMAWRRAKISVLRSEALFKQEYPATAAEAFQVASDDSFISPEAVLRARKHTAEPLGPLIMGADPSRFGDDRFSVARRRGRKVYGIESKSKLDVVAGANWLKQIIDTDKPARMFVDAGGLGAGTIDILHSWGAPYTEIVKGVNFGGSPMEPEILEILPDGRTEKRPGPRNRRAEMWSRSKAWLDTEGGVDLPDSDSLQADACAPQYKYDMQQRLQLEEKEHIRSRGIRSPDEWDAIALTFAEPVTDNKWGGKIDYAKLNKGIV